MEYFQIVKRWLMYERKQLKSTHNRRVNHPLISQVWPYHNSYDYHNDKPSALSGKKKKAAIFFHFIAFPVPQYISGETHQPPQPGGLWKIFMYLAPFMDSQVTNDRHPPSFRSIFKFYYLFIFILFLDVRICERTADVSAAFIHRMVCVRAAPDSFGLWISTAGTEIN